MKELLETVSGILFFASLLALLFIFDGTPDLWDKWHEKVMSESCK